MVWLDMCLQTWFYHLQNLSAPPGRNNNEAQKILNAAKRKSGKEYLDNTGLIIICDDYIAFRDKSDPDRFIEFIHYKVLLLLDNFSKVFVIGWSSKTYLEF